MRILCLYNIPSPYRVAFCNELSQHIDIDVVFERMTASDRNARWLSQEKLSFHPIYLKCIKLGSEQALGFGILKYLKKEYDLIIIGGYSTPTAMLSMLYLKAKKIEYVLNADGGFIKNDSKLKKIFKQFFIKGAKAWLSTGGSTTDYFVHYGAKRELIFEYPFSSFKTKDIIEKPVTQYEKNELKRKLNIKQGKISICVGQFIHRKGLDILLKAWQNMPQNYGLYIIGGNPTQEYCDIVQKKQLKNVYFLEFMDQDKLSDFYKASDVFILPTREDIWGLVIAEAMAKGLPIITTNRCNSGLQLCDESNGFIIETEDVKATNHALELILSDDLKIKSMSEHSLKKIQAYTIENMAKTHIDIFNHILSE